jgi:UDP-glucose 4-epimerase
MNIMITGGAGYVGSHLSLYLLKKKDHNIYSIDDLSNSNLSIINKIKKKFNQHFFFEKIDIRNKKKLSNFFIKNKIDVIIHLAAKIDAAESFKEKKIYKSVNLDGTKNLIKAAEYANVKKFIFASSAAVYGNSKSSICSEKKKLRPINPYGQYKLLAEKFIKKKKYKIKFVILRFFNIAGINKFFYSFFRKRTSIFFIIVNFLISRKRFFYINGTNNLTYDNSTERDFIHIDDICSIIYRVLFLEKKLILLNCGRGIKTSILQLISKLQKIARVKIKTKIIEKRIGDPRSIISDSAYLQKKIELQKFTNINTILKDGFKMALNFKKK